jgi:hypothetical protein
MYFCCMFGEPRVDAFSSSEFAVLLKMYESLLLPEADAGGLCSFSTHNHLVGVERHGIPGVGSPAGA